MPTLLDRLCDPAPIAWAIAAVHPTPASRIHVATLDLRADGFSWLLRWTRRPTPLAELHRPRHPGAPEMDPAWAFSLALRLPEALDAVAAEAAVAALEALRQAGRAPETLHRHALVLDVARLRLHQEGHARGQISPQGGLEALIDLPRRHTAHALVQIAPLRRPLPRRLLADALGPTLLLAEGHLRSSAEIRHFLQAPASAHEALALRARIAEGLAATPQPWRRRLARAAAPSA